MSEAGNKIDKKKSTTRRSCKVKKNVKKQTNVLRNFKVNLEMSEKKKLNMSKIIVKSTVRKCCKVMNKRKTHAEKQKSRRKKRKEKNKKYRKMKKGEETPKK